MAREKFMQIDDKWTCPAIGTLRIVTALLFLEHGTSKIFSFPYSAAMSGPPEWSLVWVAGIMEIIGGVMLLLGLFTRPIAFLLAGEMAIAYWMIHAPKNPFPLLNGGEGAILFCFIFLLFVATGPGSWSLDGRLRRDDDGVEGYAGPGGERVYDPDDIPDR